MGGLPRALAAAALALPALGCGPRPPAPRNVVLISVDTLRQDALGCYGNREVRTPNIDALAKDGVLFRRAFSHAPSTLPSHASMLFSEHPWSLGVFRNGDKVKPRPGSLPGALKAKGFATAAFTSLAVLDASFGLAQGFDRYADDVARNPDRPYLFADEVNERVLPWLDAHHRQPFFLFVHYSDPHEPYAPRNAPPDVELVLNDRPVGTACFLRRERAAVDLDLRPGANSLVFRPLLPSIGPRGRGYQILSFAVGDPAIRAVPPGGAATSAVAFSDSASYVLDNPARRPVATRVVFQGRADLGRSEQKREYLREVEWVDRAVGDLLTRLRTHGRYDDTLVLLVADHGEGLGDHGTMGHETQLYLSQLQVPMILVDHRHAGLESSATATLLDVAPTVLSCLGARPPDSWAGRDLSRLVERPEARRRREVFSAAFFGRDPGRPTHWKLSLLLPPHHLIVNLPAERREFYDIDADPRESRNLLQEAPHPAGLDALADPAGALARDVEARLKDRTPPDLSPEQLEKLRALGYLGGPEDE